MYVSCHITFPTSILHFQIGRVTFDISVKLHFIYSKTKNTYFLIDSAEKKYWYSHISSRTYKVTTHKLQLINSDIKDSH